SDTRASAWTGRILSRALERGCSSAGRGWRGCHHRDAAERGTRRAPVRKDVPTRRRAPGSARSSDSERAVNAIPRTVLAFLAALAIVPERAGAFCRATTHKQTEPGVCAQ